MQKASIPILLFVLGIAVNVFISRYMINDQVAHLNIPKIVVVDMAALIEKLADNKRSNAQVLIDSENIMALLRLKGFIAIDKDAVLTYSSSYSFPEFDIDKVEALLKSEGVQMAIISDVDQRLQNGRRLAEETFTLEN
jgi:hypothetical protein